MPLATLLILVVGGIAAIALLLHLLGKSAALELSEESARAAWLRQFPDDTVHAVILAESRHAALIETQAGTGLIWSFGADTVARPLGGARLSETTNALHIRFPDITAPGISLRLSPAERADWQTRISPK